MQRDDALGVMRLVQGSFRLVYETFGFLFPLGFVPSLAISLLTYLAMGGPSEPMPADFATSPAFFGALALNFVGSILVTGIMCLAALDAALGKRHSLSDYLGQALRHLAPLILLSLLVSLAVGVGATLFVIPGLYLAARFLPWTQVALFENAGWNALGRGQDLTEGYRWPLVLAIVVMGLAGLAILVVVGPLMAMAADSLILASLVEAAFTALVSALVAAFSGLAYLRLREIKEGVTAADVAGMID
jgi:hypothetical protein